MKFPRSNGVRIRKFAYAACGNLLPEQRFDHDNMCILQMTNEKVLTELDPVRVFAGVDPVTGEPIAEDWASPGAQFRAGFEGHLRKIPLGDDDAELSEVCHQSHPAPP